MNVEEMSYKCLVSCNYFCGINAVLAFAVYIPTAKKMKNNSSNKKNENFKTASALG